MTDPELAEQLKALFAEPPFVAHLGIEALGWGQGWVETRLPLKPWHLQQTGVVHAGVLTSLADHTAGGAAVTVAPPGHTVVSLEFKVNLLVGARPEGEHPRLECRAQVLKAGRRFTVVEADVFAFHGGEKVRVLKLVGTMVPVERPKP
jgi:uncharacterized protein (TIGR00369 family)